MNRVFALPRPRPIFIVFATLCVLATSAPARAQFETRSDRSIPSESVAFATGDLNNDGKLDLAILTGKGVSIALGNGDGTFQAPQTYSEFAASAALAVGDFNGDGNLDIVVTGEAYNNEVDVLLGNGDGTFQAP